MRAFAIALSFAVFVLVYLSYFSVPLDRAPGEVAAIVPELPEDVEHLSKFMKGGRRSPLVILNEAKKLASKHEAMRKADKKALREAEGENYIDENENDDGSITPIKYAQRRSSVYCRPDYDDKSLFRCKIRNKGEYDLSELTVLIIGVSGDEEEEVMEISHEIYLNGPFPAGEKTVIFVDMPYTDGEVYWSSDKAEVIEAVW